MQPQPHQRGDPVLGVEDGSAPGLSRVRGDHRGNQRPGQLVGDVGGGQAGRVQLAVSGRQRAVPRRLAGGEVYLPAPLPVDVLGHIGQQRECTECPDHRDRLVDVDAVEHLGQLDPVDLGAAHPKGFHPSPLDDVEHLLTVLLAHGVAEHPAE